MYIGKVDGWMHGVQFSYALSLAVVVLMGLSLLYILYLTIRGKLIERRIVFLYVAVAVTLPFFMSLSQEIKISPEVQQLYDEFLGKLGRGGREWEAIIRDIGGRRSER